jgi:predicted ArsR family transcriptional regulator
MPVVPAFLLHVISERGEVRNLLELANELELHYESARRGVLNLERRGLVTVHRGRRGSPLRISAVNFEVGSGESNYGECEQ